jgi:hypothetical protein
VQEKEDQVRWETTLLYALYELQNGMRLHASGKEEESSKRVMVEALGSHIGSNILCRAKYIEGLENRLGRMENLLRLSGS